MARRRFARRAASAIGRRFARKASRRRSIGSSSNPLMTIVLPGMAYGGIRNTLKGYLAPVSAMVPLGDNADEALLGLGGYFLMKNTSGFVSNMGKAAMYVESASVGHNVINPLLQNVGATAGAGSNW